MAAKTVPEQPQAVSTPSVGSEDEFDLPQRGRPAANLAERRRAQRSIFETWLVSDEGQRSLTTKVKEAKATDVADQELSIHSLMSKQGAQIIKSPRDYQMELFERAKKENTISVLDTGSGKTLIAVLLLRWTLDNELERRAAKQRPKISVFLVASITLVYQQFSVLETNLDHKIARACGPDGADHWDKSTWTRIFAENKVIVCIADVFLQCLMQSYIKIEDVNLMIVDEAHHAKKNHAYARILKYHYLEAQKESRPRIFGMTASPVDAKADVMQAAIELETIMDAKIATTTDMSLTEAVKKPGEEVLRYAKLRKPFDTPLSQVFKTRYGHIHMFEKVLKASSGIARDLGSWCSDRYLIGTLSEERLKRYEEEESRRFYQRTADANVAELDKKLEDLRAAINFVKKHPRNSEGVAEDDLSPKVVNLKRYLDSHFERPSSHRCIVFVEQKDTARMLSAIFQRIGSPHMSSAFLIGSNNDDVNENNFTTRQQIMTLVRFRKGELNCLFATSVAEEGLDVPDCNLVVRFDLYKTMIQYVQSRGRARQRNSKFIHMLEQDNSQHSDLLGQVRCEEEKMKSFCKALPEDRRLDGTDEILEDLMSKEKHMRSYTETSTGAKLTYWNSLDHLAHFVSAVPTEADEPQHATYVATPKGSKFIAEVLLPGSAPIRSAIGRICSKKSIARRSAAFEACLELRRKHYLDEHFQPTYQKRLPAMRNALLAVGMNKTNQYPVRTKPSVWSARTTGLPKELFVTIVDFSAGLERPHQPLAFLTRTSMPDFPSFPVFLSDGSQTDVVSQPLRDSLKTDDVALSKLSAFTFRVFKDVFSKTYEEDATQLTYWLAPARRSAEDPSSDPSYALDWPTLEEVFAHEEYKWAPDKPHADLANKFIHDRWDGSRKFYTVGVDPKLKATDPVPENVAKARKAVQHASILDYSNSLFKSSRGKVTWTPGQPVMEARKVITRRNLLAKPVEKELNHSTLAFLCPEPLKISTIPPTVAATCFVWPAIIHRFEDVLIALEACEMVGVTCEPKVALAAVTKDSDNSGDHQEQQRINFRSGMGENYERLEFIGDTFLKTATTISTFIQNPGDNEFEFHVKRMLLLCNKNLFKVAKELQLHEYIRSQAFSRRGWYPKGLKLLEGKGAGKNLEESSPTHGLGEKTIADVCEALIGAAFVTHDRPGCEWKEADWENAVRAVTKLCGSPDHAMICWDDYRKAYKKPNYQTAEVTASQRDLAEQVEQEHPYRFNYPRLLRSAFIHPSQPLMYEKVPNYQRLEFLGDALLDMVSITHLFYRFPDADPQWLTEHKMAMVSNKFLGAVCAFIGFHRHLRYSSPIMEHQIREYITELQDAKATAGDSRDYWTTVSDPPKCLPDIVEAFVGAMFIDSDFDYRVVQRFFDAHIAWYFKDMSIYDSFANNHPCTRLHTLLDTTYGCQDYRLMAKELPPADGVDQERKDIVAVVMVHDLIVAHTKGKSGRYARSRVASSAIEAIEGLAPYEFRAKFGCECLLKAEKEKLDGPSGVDGVAPQSGLTGVVTSTFVDCGV